MMDRLPRRMTVAARRVALWYGLFAAVWIYASDRLLDALIDDPRLLSLVQSLKGWAFVLVTALLVYALLHRELRVQERLAAEERETRTQLRDQLAMLQALHRGAIELTHSPDVITLSNAIIHTCVETFGARLAWLGSAEADGRIQPLAWFPPDSAYLRGRQIRWDETPQGGGPTGRAIRSLRPVVTTDIAHDPTFVPWREAALVAGFNSCAAFPLTSRERALGTLNLYSDQPDYFSPQRVDFFQTYAQLAGAALERARLYDALRRGRDELEQRVAERTAQLSEAVADIEAFAYSVSHDLRAPLRALEGFARALLEDYGPRLDDTGRDYAQRIEQAARRMDQLIQDILAYSRLNRAQLALAPIALDAVVIEALRMLDVELRACAAQVQVERPLPGVIGHQPTLLQVLANLLSNAIKFVPPGTTPVLKVSAQQSDGRVRVWVEDNGIGIDAQHQQRIFRVFERLHGIDVYPGTGIGLAIVHKALERMGGKVGVESQLHRGSRFWFELPATEANA